MAVKQKRWSDDDINYLKKNYGKIKCVDIAKAMGRGASAVVCKAKRLGLEKKNRAWTAKEKAKVRKMVCAGLSHKEIAVELKRSLGSIDSVCSKQGFAYGKRYSKWTEQDDDYLIKQYGKKSNEFIANKLKRTDVAIMKRAFKLGLGPKTEYEGFIPASRVCKVISGNNSYGTYQVGKYIKMGLPVFVMNIGRFESRNNLMVDLDKFWEWLEKNKDKVDFLKFEKYSLGPEPTWVDQYRKFQWKKFREERWKDYDQLG